MKLEDLGKLIDTCKEFDISIRISEYGIEMTKYCHRNNKALRFSRTYDYKDFYDLNDEIQQRVTTIEKLVQLFVDEANYYFQEEYRKINDMCSGSDKSSVNIVKEIYGGKTKKIMEVKNNG